MSIMKSFRFTSVDISLLEEWKAKLGATDYITVIRKLLRSHIANSPAKIDHSDIVDPFIRGEWHDIKPPERPEYKEKADLPVDEWVLKQPETKDYESGIMYKVIKRAGPPFDTRILEEGDPGYNNY